MDENGPDCALLCLAAEDTYCGAKKTARGPLSDLPPDPRLSPAWRVCGTITAQDAILLVGPLQIGAERVPYGWLLQSTADSTAFALVSRGTEGAVEWVEDAGWVPMTAHPVRGRVETGFWRIFATMELDGKPLVTEVLNRVGSGRLVVTGHSLGAPLMTFAAFELSDALGSRLKARLIASPHPGDAEFSKAFGERVPDHLMWANDADKVPTVPAWFDYRPVPRVETLDAGASGIEITGGWAGQHHCLTYASLINRSLPQPAWMIPADAPFAGCIRARGSFHPRAAQVTI